MSELFARMSVLLESGGIHAGIFLLSQCSNVRLEWPERFGSENRFIVGAACGVHGRRRLWHPEEKVLRIPRTFTRPQRRKDEALRTGSAW